MNKNVEILAPAGSTDSLVAAVRSGANAVYLGVGNFNARRNAENFNVDTLKQTVAYCHLRGVKVYLTLNTLINDGELSEAFEVIKCGCASGADAFIIQDLGIAKLVKEIAPSMPLHASTQMAVSTPAGFKELENLGFTRAVIPRELSFSEIQEIRNQTNIELEMFVHGALCMCVSGQCYLSSMIGGRSGNRGLCAQPCRLPFAAPNGTGYDLSLKDLSLIDNLSRLRDLGIASFKIEGRMKRPEYVAAAVTACKKALSGCKDDELYSNLRAVFSRSGFTDGYYTESLGKNMFGTRGKEDVTAANAVFKSLQKLYEKEEAVIPISIGFTAEIGKPIMVSASTGKTIAFATSDSKVQVAKSHATEVSTIRTQLKKCGGTPFSVKMTDISVDENINIPVSEINNTRRKVLAELENKLTQNTEKPISDKIPNLKDLKERKNKNTRLSITSKPKIYVRLDSIDQISRNIDPSEYASRFGIDKIIVPLRTPEDKFSILKKLGIPFGVEIPRGLYGSTSKIEKQLKNAIKHGVTFIYAPSLDSVIIANKINSSNNSSNCLPIIGGFTLNAFNSFSVKELIDTFHIDELTLSMELRLSEINKIRTDEKIGICTYGRVPLMLTRNCPIKNGKDCKSCNRDSYLTDRKGIRFPVVCTENMSEVLNSLPIYLADKQDDYMNLDFQLLYFTKESPEKVTSILSSYINKKEPQLEFTRGLYYRGVE